MQENYQLNVANDTEFNITASDIAKLDILPLGKDEFHLLHQQKSYRVAIKSKHLEDKTYEVVVNGSVYPVKISDTYDLLVKKMGLSVGKNTVVNDIKAPMPGLVLEVLVEEGTAVEKGDALIILEAMKMENVLKASGSGVVKSVAVEKGNTVNKGDLLIDME